MAGRWVLIATTAVSLVHCNQHLAIDDIIPHVYEPTWMYKCVPDEGCQRTERPQPTAGNVTGGHLYTSIDVCRTLCGRFGGLWPKPVTAALSSQTVMIHPNMLSKPAVKEKQNTIVVLS